jgi:hypothetical protein
MLGLIAKDESCFGNQQETQGNNSKDQESLTSQQKKLEKRLVFRPKLTVRLKSIRMM